MKIRITLGLLILVLGIWSCKGSKKTTDTTDSGITKTSNMEDAGVDQRQEGAGALLIQMRRSACFGSCPVFTLKVLDNGRVEYHGDNHTDKLGLYSRTLLDEEYSDLARTFRLAHLEQYDTTYFSGATDFPITTLIYHGKNFSKTIKGDFQVPEAVQNLEKILDSIALQGQWTQEEVQMPRGAIANELIVELVADKDAYRWAARQNTYGLEVVRQIAPNLNLWLLRFDPEQVKPERLVVLLRNQTEVKQVEFNKKLEQRN